MAYNGVETLEFIEDTMTARSYEEVHSNLNSAIKLGLEVFLPI